MLLRAFDANQPKSGEDTVWHRVDANPDGTEVMKRLCLALAILLVCSEGSYALDREQRRAQALLRELCSSCHAVDRTGRSPHAYAPAFRNLPETTLYDGDFGQRLQDGLSTMHPDMPTFHFSERDAEAVVDYLRAIQNRTPR